MNIFYYFICSLFVLLSLYAWSNITSNRYTPAEYVVLAQQIRADVATNLTKRYSMRLIGITGGLADCVNVLGLSFQIQGPLNKSLLREIIVNCVEEFLTSINQNERLRPFLKNYPFTAKELIIKIFIVDQNGIEIYEPEISVVAEYAGKIWYDSLDRECISGYKSTITEDYQTALEIVRETKQDPSVKKETTSPINSFKKPPVFLFEDENYLK